MVAPTSVGGDHDARGSLGEKYWLGLVSPPERGEMSILIDQSVPEAKTARRGPPSGPLLSRRFFLRLAFPRLRQFLEQMRRRQHPVVQVIEVQLLVGGVGVLVGQTPHG